MLDEEHLTELRDLIRQAAEEDTRRLQRLQSHARELAGKVHPIRPRTATAISLVAADGGSDAVLFDPYMLYITRVVDSYGKIHFQDTLSPFMDIRFLSRRHLEGKTPLGRLMEDLGVEGLWELSLMIPKPGTPEQRIHPGWLEVYRDLGEWAVLYDYLTGSHFPSHTLVVRDGLLRSKIFAADYFPRMWERIREHLQRIRREEGRKVFVAGVAKRSKVLDRYRLAFSLEKVLVQEGPSYLEVPPEMEREVYRWEEYARRGSDGEEGEEKKIVQGALFLAKFGPHPRDPIWPVDIWLDHVTAGEAEAVLGYLLADAQEGFPSPYYPLCLQRAHEGAVLKEFDTALLQELLWQAIYRGLPPEEAGLVDAFRLHRPERRMMDGRD
ncbi:MAG: hypothetical protein QJR00_07565 [Bacillota bacterium]|nr:hypothetical protein [Bacillota bacterium]